MKYTNVPLPTPIIERIDKILLGQTTDYRSRPDFILHHIRIALEKFDISQDVFSGREKLSEGKNE